MSTTVVRTQAEFDALPRRFDEFTIIEIRAEPGLLITVSAARDNSTVEARDNSRVEAWGNSSVVAWGASSISARGKSFVRVFSPGAKVELQNASIAILQVPGATALRKSERATIVEQESKVEEENCTTNNDLTNSEIEEARKDTERLKWFFCKPEHLANWRATVDGAMEKARLKAEKGGEND